jgi:hypothetical protein
MADSNIPISHRIVEIAANTCDTILCVVATSAPGASSVLATDSLLMVAPLVTIREKEHLFKVCIR